MPTVTPLASLSPTLSLPAPSVDTATFNFNGVFPAFFFLCFWVETDSLAGDFWNIFFAIFEGVVGSSLPSFCCFLVIDFDEIALTSALPDCCVKMGSFAKASTILFLLM